MNLCPATFHYLTIDPLNASAAEEVAAARGVSLAPAEPRDVPQLEKQHARLIVDWDFLPPDDRDRVLSSPWLHVAAIHGFGVPESVACFLPRRGILYCKQLSPEMFRRLEGLQPAA